MVSKKWWRIVNIGSSSSYNGFKNTSIYCSSKHALLGLSRSLHDELKEHNIRTFCVSPGSIKTSMGKRVIGQNYDTFMDPKEIAEWLKAKLVIDRWRPVKLYKGIYYNKEIEFKDRWLIFSQLF